MARKANKEVFENVVLWALRRECAGHAVRMEYTLYGDLALDSIDMTDAEMLIEEKLRLTRPLHYPVRSNTTVREFVDGLYEEYLDS